MVLIYKKRKIRTMQNSKSLIFFCMPMLYSFRTRYKGKVGISAWIVKYFIPIFCFGLCTCNFSFCNFVFGLLFLYSLYEIGYIQNDCETIKKEEEPTLRISETELRLYEQKKVYIYIIRILQILLWGYILYQSGVSLYLLIYGFLTLPVFILYNNIRNGFCLFIHLILMMFRYSVPVFISSNKFSITILIFILFIYPLTLFIERSVKGKFGYYNSFFSKYLMHKYNDRYSFRVKYYIVLFFFTIHACYYLSLSVMFIIPVIILLVTSIVNVHNSKLHYDK